MNKKLFLIGMSICLNQEFIISGPIVSKCQDTVKNHPTACKLAIVTTATVTAVAGGYKLYKRNQSTYEKNNVVNDENNNTTNKTMDPKKSPFINVGKNSINGSNNPSKSFQIDEAISQTNTTENIAVVALQENNLESSHNSSSSSISSEKLSIQQKIDSALKPSDHAVSEEEMTDIIDNSSPKKLTTENLLKMLGTTPKSPNKIYRSSNSTQSAQASENNNLHSNKANNETQQVSKAASSRSSSDNSKRSSQQTVHVTFINIEESTSAVPEENILDFFNLHDDNN